MPVIYVLRHSEEVPPGYLADALDASGFDWKQVRLDLGEELPLPDTATAVVSLGGIMGAYDEDQFPFLVEEKEFLRECVARATPVLGICLGCQLLADALGGRAYKAAEMEVAFAQIERSRDGEADPVVGALRGPTVMWHQDTWEAPPGSAVLARSALYPQAFRYGSAVGIQPHPEASPAIVESWARTPTGAGQLEALGIEPGTFVGEVVRSAPAVEAQASAVFGAWLDEVAEVRPSV